MWCRQLVSPSASGLSPKPPHGIIERNAQETTLALSITACNRTYYGERGRTYELEILRPRHDRLPYVCQLVFIAAGMPQYGQLLQLSFEGFTLGQFTPYADQGCRDAYMQISEMNRPFVDGYWCGHAWGYNVYYSETPTVTITLKVLSLSNEGRYFDFQLKYKFIAQEDAIVRYGPPNNSVYRGDLVDNTVCHRVYDGCDKKECRIQSPNYPGMYPRNITCYYTIKQTDIPDNMHAMIVIKQDDGHKLHIKDKSMVYESQERTLKFWDECDTIGDYVSVYDGTSILSPLLVKFCRGDRLGQVISSDSELSVVFHSSPFDKPFHPIPLRYLPGFELEANVKFIPKSSKLLYMKDNKCEFRISSKSSSGIILNPVHTIPPNTTCSYYFEGKQDEVIWLYFLKYHIKPLYETSFQEGECRNILKIEEDSKRGNSKPKLLGKYCDENSPPLCNHATLSENNLHPRPCTSEESFISSGNYLKLTQQLPNGTFLNSVSFNISYEFVDTSMPGKSVNKGNDCHRVFKSRGGSKADGKFYSPRNVFMFGRGGKKDLRCSYKFIGLQDERIKISIRKLHLNEIACETITKANTEQTVCQPRQNLTASLTIAEYPWADTQLSRYCLCQDIRNRNQAKVLESSSNILEVNFTILNMNHTQDFTDFFFQGTYEFIRRPLCVQNRRLNDSNGIITFIGSSENVQELNCNRKPWVIVASRDKYIYLKIRGKAESSEKCTTKSRIVVFSPGSPKALDVVCPSEKGDSFVEVFSKGWTFQDHLQEHLHSKTSRNLIVDFIAKEPGIFTAKWLEVSKPPQQNALGYSVGSGLEECTYTCPELQACINAQLWCDGIPHCPSGYDESSSNCFALNFPWLYAGVGAGIVVLIFISILGSFIHHCNLKSKKKKGAKRVPTEEFIIDGKENFC